MSVVMAIQELELNRFDKDKELGADLLNFNGEETTGGGGCDDSPPDVTKDDDG
jgi:hypothetical protein